MTLIIRIRSQVTHRISLISTLALFLTLTSQNSVGGGAQDVGGSCTFESFSSLYDDEFKSERSVTLKPFKYSAEGSQVEAYFIGQSIVKIDASLFGETQKTHIVYIFQSSNDYMVDFTEDIYSSPIYTNDSRVVATIRVKFIVCEGKIKIPINESVIRSYGFRATAFLNDILSDLNKAR